MANDWLKAMQAVGGLAPAAGVGIGLAAGGPVGAAIGGAVGGIVGGAANLFAPTPSMPGPSGAQRSLLSTQIGVVNDIQAQNGVTAGQVSRMQETAVSGQKQQLQQANLAAQFAASPLEREMITTAIMNQMRSTSKDIKDRIAEFDAATEAQKADRLARATAVASQQAAQIQQIEANQRMAQMQAEQAKWNNFGNMLGQSVQGISSVMQYQDNLKAETQRTADMKKFREDYLAAIRGDVKKDTTNTTTINDKKYGITTSVPIAKDILDATGLNIQNFSTPERDTATARNADISVSSRDLIKNGYQSAEDWAKKFGVTEYMFPDSGR